MTGADAAGGLGGTTNGIDALRRRPRPALLRWAVGIFCALIGALMLIAPHQFARLATLVANLLEVARGSADLARTVVEAARVRAREHRIVVEAPERVELVADPLRIEQVLTNLVDNAVKYSPPGSAIEVTVLAGPDSAEVAIRDHGMGIPREHRHRIFDRFFQAHVGEHASGMGLGLYISQKIVRHHGGTIRVEAPEDGGTRMIVSLPRRVPREGAPEPAAPSGQRSARRPGVTVAYPRRRWPDRHPVAILCCSR